MGRSNSLRLPLLATLLTSLLQAADANLRVNQRIFVQAKAISFVDPTKRGFRIILYDTFLKQQLAPTLLPMLYITAIPLRKDSKSVIRVINPESIYDDKQVNIGDLAERSWYSLCVEWENYSRHNETMGSDCRLFRTLDRAGQGADTTIEDVAIPDTESQAVIFRIKTSADFPLRISVMLRSGAAVPPSSEFFVSEPSELEGSFHNLRRYTNYGRLCVLEQPQLTGYSAMGRLVSGLTIQKCYFSDITTKDYELSNFMDPEASAFSASASTRSSLFPLIVLLLMAVTTKK